MLHRPRLSLLLSLLLIVVTPTIGQSFPAGSITSMSWSSDGTRIALAFEDGTLEIVNLETEQSEFTFSIDTVPVTTISWNPDNRLLATGIGYKIYVLDTVTFQTHFVLEGHTDAIASLAWSHNGKWLASTSIGGVSPNLRIWDMDTGNPIIITGTEQLSSISWSPDDKQVVIGAGLAIRILDPITGAIQLLSNQSLHGGVVLDVAWSPLGDQIASSSFFGEVRIWNAVTGQLEHNLIGHSDLVTSVVTSVIWTPDAVNLASVSTDGTVRIWNSSNGQNLNTFQIDTETVDFSPFGGRLAFGVSPTTNADDTTRNHLENVIQTLANGAIQIIVPDPSLERLQSIANLCNAPLTVADAIPDAAQTDQLINFIAQIQSLPADSIPSACAADLIAVAQAIQAGQ